MGANASKTRQKLENTVQNTIDQKYSIDQSTNCKMSADTSQTMSGITIKGSRDVALKQKNDLENLCVATSATTLDVLSQLSSKAQNDIFKEAVQEGGIGINVSDTSQDVITRVSNEVTTEVAMNMAKDCLTQVKAPQIMENITIEDAMNINLTQESSAFNKCIFDSATNIADKNQFDLDVKTKAGEKIEQKGWDRIFS